jgi:hypothetical protein
MDLVLEIGRGTITGEGNDPVGPFVISGRYDATSGECHWSKLMIFNPVVCQSPLGSG